MPSPRVFVSSTCYDLKYIRENLRYLVRTLGYDPVLSEDGTIFYDPNLHTQDACLAEVPNCQLFVLIIGGRFGGTYHDSEHSITNAEYREAVRLKLPVFALIDSAVYNEHHLYIKNRGNDNLDRSLIVYPSTDSTKIFDFVDEVRSNAVNNALVPFRDFGDIESYLRQQWASLMFDFLTRRNEERRVADTLTTLAEMNSRIEVLSRQILISVGTEDAKIDAALYEEMLASEAIRDLAFLRVRPTPASVFVNSSFRSCAKSLGVALVIAEDDDESSITGSGRISRVRFEVDSNEYRQLRQRLGEILTRQNMTPESYIQRSAQGGTRTPESDNQPSIDLRSAPSPIASSTD
jgi:hypothetical protein